MIFGIKTKKDKKIEKLQAEIEVLKTATLPIQLEYRNADVVTYHSEYAVPFEALERVSEHLIKGVLANKLLDVLSDNLEIETTDDFFRCMKLYRAELKVVHKC